MADDDIFNQEPSIRWEQETLVVPMYVNQYGVPITNSAGQTFDPPIQVDVIIPILIITQNMANFSIQEATAVTGAVSKDFYFGPPGTAQVVSRSAERAYKNGTDYWRVTTRIRFRQLDGNGDSAWGTYIIDEGTMQLKGGELVPIYINGERVTTPVGLNGKGVYSPTASIIYIPPAKSANLGGLGLPSF